jgi:hypothetical protein
MAAARSGEGAALALEILPSAQRRLWDELGGTSPDFVLYGGTALALRLGHRQSGDFDFFSAADFDPARLMARTPYLRGAEVVQQAPNTLGCRVDRGGPVLVSFFGGLGLGRVGVPDRAGRNGVLIASMLDLAATKVQVVQTRAAARDYLDLDALLRSTEVSLRQAIGAAAAVFGTQFNPLPSLKALSSFSEGDLEQVPGAVRRRLARAVRDVDPDHLPVFCASEGLAPGGTV